MLPSSPSHMSKLHTSPFPNNQTQFSHLHKTKLPSFLSFLVWFNSLPTSPVSGGGQKGSSGSRVDEAGPATSHKAETSCSLDPTDLFFLRGLMDSPIMKALIKVSIIKHLLIIFTASLHLFLVCSPSWPGKGLNLIPTPDLSHYLSFYLSPRTLNSSSKQFKENTRILITFMYPH